MNSDKTIRFRYRYAMSSILSRIFFVSSFLMLSLLSFGQTSGCTDITASNYDLNATIDDGSCFIVCNGTQIFINVNFSKDDFADWTLEQNQDRIAPDVWITRQNSQGLFNIAVESAFNYTGEPSNTLWKAGNYNPADNPIMDYLSWRDHAGGAGNLYLLPGTTSTLYLVDYGIYFKIDWNSWASGGTGGFSYTRTWIDTGFCSPATCNDPSACNYNIGGVDSLDCVYASGCDICSGSDDGYGAVIDQDADDDGVCDLDEIPGCSQANAANYDPVATDDDGSCYFICNGIQIFQTQEFSKANFADWSLEENQDRLAPDVWLTRQNQQGLYNAATDIAWANGIGGPRNTLWKVGSYDAADNALVDYQTWSDHIGGDGNVNSLPISLSTLYLVDYDLYFEIEWTNWSCCFQGGFAYTRTFINTGLCGPSNCNDPVACNYNINGINTLDCVYESGCDICSGGDDGFGFVIDQDIDDDGICDANEILGCNQMNAVNYDPSTTENDGSCYYTCNGVQIFQVEEFSKANYADWTLEENQDRLAPDVWITRQDQQGLFNIAVESVYSTYLEPSNTLWKSGPYDPTDDPLNNYQNWRDHCSPTPDYLPGSVSTLYLVDYDLYFNIEWSSWTCCAAGGGFAYKRTLVNNSLCLAPTCNDPLACNYDVAGTEAGSCIYPTACDTCSGETDGTGSVIDGDADDDGICDGDEIVGCQNAMACNYNAAATDSGTCILPGDVCDDGNASTIDDIIQANCGCAGTLSSGCTDIAAENYNPALIVDDGSCTYCSSVVDFDSTLPDPILIGSGLSNQHMAVADDCPIVAGLKAHYRYTGDITPTGNTYRALTGESPTSGIDPTPDAGTATWNYLLSVNLGTLTFEEVNVYLDIDFDPSDGGGQVGPFFADVSQTMIDNGLGATSFIQDSQNLGFGFWQLIGSPDILPFDPFANGVYDIAIRVVSPLGAELINVPIRVETFTEGCTDNTACNYNMNASDDDGSCEYSTCAGCTESTAINYNPAATIDDGSCEINCNCEVVSFSTGGVFEKIGFADFTLEENQDRIAPDVWITRGNNQGLYNIATDAGYSGGLGGPRNTLWKLGSYDPLDDPLVDYQTWVAHASNDPSSLIGQSSVLYLVDYDVCFQIDWSGFTSGGTTGGGFAYSRTLIDTGDCDNVSPIPGCTDMGACNYDAGVNCDDGSCILPVANCSTCNATNDGLDIVDADGDGVCDADEVLGCSDIAAENYNLAATDNDGTCTYCSSVVDYDATLPDPIVIGSGLSNQHMAVADDCPIVVGLKAFNRFTGDIIPTGDTYNALAGESPTSGIDPTPDAGIATWNYLLSVNLGTLTFEEINVYLDIDFDPSDGGGQVGPFTADVSQTMIDNGLGATSFIQDSQNLGFGFWQLIGSPDILPFDPFAGGVYDIAVRVVSPEGVELINVPIRVVISSDGCTDIAACNYDINATNDDGSCIVPVANCSACNAANDGLDIVDTDGDGVCDADEAPGCTNADACNYDFTADTDDGSCVVPVANCSACNATNDGLDLVDTDGDGVCDANEAPGCTNADACNYDFTADTDDGSCVVPVANCSACNSANDGLDIIDTDGDGVCDANEVPGCTNPNDCNYLSTATDDDGSCTITGGGTADFCLHGGFQCNPVQELCPGEGNYYTSPTSYLQNIGASLAEIAVVTSWTGFDGGTTMTISLNGSPIFTEFNDSGTCEPVKTYTLGVNDLTGQLSVDNILEVSFDNTAQYAGIQVHVTYVEQGGFGCADASACNYDAGAGCDDGSCIYTSDACGICGGAGTVSGCTNPVACNYDPAADCDDDSCSFPPNGETVQYCLHNGFQCNPVQELCPGEGNYYTSPTSYLQNIGASLAEIAVVTSWTGFDGGTTMTISLNGSPIFTEFNDSSNCEPVKTYTFDVNDLIAQLPANNILVISFNNTAQYAGIQVLVTHVDQSGIGCTDVSSCNYKVDAICDDGSCIASGCTYADACNYNSSAGCDDGSCEYVSCEVFGCTYPNATNYDMSASIDDGNCEFESVGSCPQDLNGDGIVNTGDLNNLLGVYGSTCP